MGLQSGGSPHDGFLARVLKPSIWERGAQVASAQAGAPQIITRAGFGEVAFTNVSKGNVYFMFW